MGERNSNIEDALREMGNLVSSRSREPHRHNSESAVPDSESHDDSIFLATNGYIVESSILHKTTNRLNSTGSEYNGIIHRRDSQLGNLNQRVDQYWTSKLAELETYDQWDKQYLLDSMLRDAIILERPAEIRKLISLGADVHQTRFPQFCRQAKKSIYDYALETNDPNIVSILVQAGCQRTS